MSSNETRMVTRADRETLKRWLKSKARIIQRFAIQNDLQVVDIKCPVVETYAEDYLGLPEVKGD